MFLGQLYYYDAKLNQLPLAIEQNRLDLIDLCGVNMSDASLVGLNSHELSRKLKDLFSKNYIHVLEENNLFAIAAMWKSITSAHKQTQSFRPRTEYQISILDWAVDGYPIDKIMALVKEGQLVQDEDDLALYYGIKVLFELTTLSLEGIYQPSQLSHEDIINDVADHEPTMIVVTNQRKSPLYQSVSCTTILPQQDTNQMIANLKNTLSNLLSIQIILLDYQLDDSEFLLIAKAFPDILVSHFDIELLDSQSTGYFKTLAKKTLGIRL